MSASDVSPPFGFRSNARRPTPPFTVVLLHRCDDQNVQTIAAVTPKKMITPITIERFTLVVRLRTLTSGNPELCLSIDMAGHGPIHAPLVPRLVASDDDPDLFPIQSYFGNNSGGVGPA